MNYKVGDKIKIKTWEEMEKEFGFGNNNKTIITCSGLFNSTMEKEIEELKTNRILTVKEVEINHRYRMKERTSEIAWTWSDDIIRCLVKDYKVPDPIKSRLEILDL